MATPPLKSRGDNGGGCRAPDELLQRMWAYPGHIRQGNQQPAPGGQGRVVRQQVGSLSQAGAHAFVGSGGNRYDAPGLAQQFV